MRSITALASTLILTLAACSPTSGPNTNPTVPLAGNGAAQSDVSTPDPSTGTDPVANPQLIQAALRPVDDCDALLDYFITQAVDQVGPWGLGGGNFWVMEGDGTTDTMAAAESAGSGQAPATPSATNVQVEGVDEADIVKAVGDRLYVISESRLVIFSTADGGAERLGSLNLGQDGWGSQMLVRGDRLVLMGFGSSSGAGPDRLAPEIWPGPSSSFATVALVDVSDPANPVTERKITMDGTVVTSRLVEDSLRIILQAEPVGLTWSQPEGSGLQAERASTERNREVIRNSTIENWLPYLISSDGTEQTLLDCGDVYLPPEPSGLGTLSILDFDLSTGIDNWDASAVIASGSTVYSNVGRTFIATSQWLNPALIQTPDDVAGHKTQIHMFDTPVDGAPQYVASGSVDGFLLNQFAMDEFDGHLRVASTSDAPWWGGTQESESRVTVLSAEGDHLVVDGTVDGLGVTETIQAVRFMGPVGYVVTFRQTDPLYVIDLSDPANPVKAGELKIPGFSAYLHPVGEGRMLGVGQDADPETGAQLGLQLSLFDVSDPTSPKRLDTFGLGADKAPDSNIYSIVQNDHRAFTSIDGAGFVPYEGYSWNEGDQSETIRMGIIQVDWAGDTLDASKAIEMFRGKPTGEQWIYSPQRVVVKGDVAYVIGSAGLTVLDLTDGSTTTQTRF